MIEILKEPTTTIKRIFHCCCGCVFQADLVDYNTRYKKSKHNDKILDAYYQITCPHCGIDRLYAEEDVETKIYKNEF